MSQHELEVQLHDSSPLVATESSAGHMPIPPSDSEKPHVIAFVNFGSGSGKGDELTKMLTTAIGPDNIYKLGGGQQSPRDVLQTVYETHQKFRVIVCGGDGSVNWILSVIADLGYDDVSVGIIPNGTGNDTSRYLGWGQCQFNSKTTQANINKMIDPITPSREFDRWQLFFSFRKDEMAARTDRLMKTEEVPMSHTWVIQSNQISNYTTRNKDNTKLSQKKSDESEPLGPTNNNNNNNNKGNNATSSQNSSNGSMRDYYFPKYFKCMTRLDELQFLERYKWLHHNHQPESFLLLSLEDKRHAQLRASSLNPTDNNNNNNNDNNTPSTVMTREQYANYLENASKWIRFTWSFNNYFSLGVDAQAMNFFGIHRDNNPCCYQCRCCTLTWIGACSTATCIRCQKKPLTYRIDILYKEGDLTPAKATPTKNIIPHPLAQLDVPNINSNGQQLPIPDNDEDIEIVVQTTHGTIEESTSTMTSWAGKDEAPFVDNPSHLVNGYKWLSATFSPEQYGALVLLNIPSYAGGRNIWGTKTQMNKKTQDYLVQEFDQDTKDGRLELLAFSGFQQMQFTIMTQSSTYRLGQLQGLRIYMPNDAYVQLDGEAWIQPQGIIEIFRSKPGKMLFNDNPDYPCC